MPMPVPSSGLPGVQKGDTQGTKIPHTINAAYV